MTPEECFGFLSGAMTAAADGLRMLSSSTGMKLVEFYISVAMLFVSMGFPDTWILQETAKLLFLFTLLVTITQKEFLAVRHLFLFVSAFTWAFGTMALLNTLQGEAALAYAFPVGYVMLSFVAVGPVLDDAAIVILELGYIYILSMMWLTGIKIASVLGVSDPVRLTTTFAIGMLFHPKANPRRLLLTLAWSLRQLTFALLCWSEMIEQGSSKVERVFTWPLLFLHFDLRFAVWKRADSTTSTWAPPLVAASVGVVFGALTGYLFFVLTRSEQRRAEERRARFEHPQWALTPGAFTNRAGPVADQDYQLRDAARHLAPGDPIVALDHGVDREMNNLPPAVAPNGQPVRAMVAAHPSRSARSI